ncbi:unnamed protein product [Ophioblennius macclurei]
MLLLVLLLLMPSSDEVQARRMAGLRDPVSGSCRCRVDSSTWAFPADKFVSVLERLKTCRDSVTKLQEQVQLSSQRLPQMEDQITNMSARLEPYQYLHNRGLYTALTLRQLSEELNQLESDISVVNRRVNSTQTRKIQKEVSLLLKDAKKMKTSDTINMKTVRDKLRYLKNNVESCKSFPKDFRSEDRHCRKGLIAGISAPVTSKISPHGKTHVSGSWGKQAQEDSEGQKNSYWVQPLLSSNIFGNTLRVYKTYEDFMASANHRDFTFAPSYTDAKTLEGPSAVLYGEALYYHCYRSAAVCRYDLNTNLVASVTLPGTEVGINNKFPYCYYDCRANSDVDVEADETGLWAIYATVGNHGNLVVSRLVWDAEAGTLNVTQTWETRQFKKATSNAFMACGVLYATRYVDEFREEVFYAFDTGSGREDNSLALPLEKVAKGVASLSYNPTDRQLYMYNDGYLLAYQTSV